MCEELKSPVFLTNFRRHNIVLINIRLANHLLYGYAIYGNLVFFKCHMNILSFYRVMNFFHSWIWLINPPPRPLFGGFWGFLTPRPRLPLSRTRKALHRMKTRRLSHQPSKLHHPFGLCCAQENDRKGKQRVGKDM
jgi:hypothetical protein